MIKTALATLLTAKVAAPAAAAAAVGGIALASTTGALPLPGDSPAEPPVNPAPTSSVSTPSTTPGGNADTPSLIGLCQAYTSSADNEHGIASESPAFEVLITEAGGKDNVAAYCGDVLAERPGKPSTLPTQAEDRGQAPETRPTGAPETVPSETARPDNDDAARPTTTPEHPDGQPDSEPTTTPENPDSDYSEDRGDQTAQP